VLTNHVAGFLEHFGAVEFDECVLKVSETRHEKSGFVGSAEPAIDFECSNVFTGPFCATGRRFKIAGELPEITGLSPAVEIFEKRRGNGPSFRAARKIDRRLRATGRDQDLHRLLNPAR